MRLDAEVSDKGTFAVPLYFIPCSSPSYEPTRKLYDRLTWPQGRPRADAYEKRYDAFCSLLKAAQEDPDWIIHATLNKANYNENKWRINYRAMSDLVKALLASGWIEKVGKVRRHRNQRYFIPPKSPIRKLPRLAFCKHYWEPPLVSIRAGNTDLEKAPLDVELMANKTWKAWIRKHLYPKMEELNDKLLDHQFTFFPFGKANEDEAPQYHRIYTNVSGFKENPELLHGRIYPRNFIFPSKARGWRQMTLIDGEPTKEVDVHASSLTLLAGDPYLGFELPDCDDFYSFGELAHLNREVTKKVFQAILNGVSPQRKTWPTGFTDNPETASLIGSDSFPKYAKAVVATYPSLEQLRPNMGLSLMLFESDIIMRAMLELLDKGIGCLSIHDCLIVPKSQVNQAKAAFNNAYAYHHYPKPKLKVS